MIAVDPYFDPKITLGSVLVASSMMVAAATSAVTGLIAWRDLNWRVKNNEKWQGEQDKQNDQRDKIVVELKELVIEMKAVVTNSDKRIERGEQRVERLESVMLHRGGKSGN